MLILGNLNQVIMERRLRFYLTPTDFKHNAKTERKKNRKQYFVPEILHGLGRHAIKFTVNEKQGKVH